MGTLITPWHKDHDLSWNHSQLVPMEFKSGPSYVKHIIGPYLEIHGPHKLGPCEKMGHCIPLYGVSNPISKLYYRSASFSKNIGSRSLIMNLNKSWANLQNDKIVCKSWTPKQHDHGNHAQGSVMVHSSGTQGTQNDLRQLLVPNNLKIQNTLARICHSLCLSRM